MHLRRFAAALCVVTSGVAAQAAPLAPESSVFDGDSQQLAQTDPNGTSSAQQNTSVTADTFSGVLESNVVTNDTSNPWGGLTFTYRFINDSDSLGSVARLALPGFASFLTDVSYHVDNSGSADGVQPYYVDRDAAGVVGFSFVSPEKVDAGLQTALLVIQTNATDYGLTQASLINGSTATADAYTPVPEPASLLLLGAGATLLLGRRHA